MRVGATTIWQYLLKLNICITCDEALLTLMYVHCRDVKICSSKGEFIRIFIVALFAISPKWKQYSCLLTVE